MMRKLGKTGQVMAYKMTEADKAIRWAQNNGYYWDIFEHNVTVGDDQPVVKILFIYSWHAPEFCELGYCYDRGGPEVDRVVLFETAWLDEGGRWVEQADIDAEYERGDLNWIIEDELERN